MSSSSNPYMKFYVSDWRADEALRICSLAARGLWIEMLCIMHGTDGYLTVNGQPMTDSQLAILTGTPTDQLPDLLGELESAGVFSRTKSNVIYSRRVVRDRKRSREGRKAVRKRWSQPSENKQEKPPPNRSPNSTPNREPITQKPETRNQNTPKPPEGDFEEFYDLFPRKEGRPKALEKYQKLIKSGKVTHAELMDGLRRYLKHLEKNETWRSPKGPTAWLNQGFWENEYPDADPKPVDENHIWEVRMNIHYRDNVWPEEWGPAPGEPGCEVPQAYLRKEAS